MASTSETGHAKNVANLQSLISFCQGYGASYNPSKESLSIASLKSLLTEAGNNLQTTKAAETTFNNATNIRQNTFKDLRPFCTKIVNAFAVSGAKDAAIADVRAVNKKIQTPSKKSVAATASTTDTPPKTAISTSQQSYDSLIDHFTKMIEALSQSGSYQPNEKELQIETLREKLTSLKTANTDLINNYTNWSNARIARNSRLYDPLTGLVQTASDVKKYIKSVYGATSPQYKQVASLQFKNIKEN